MKRLVWRFPASFGPRMAATSHLPINNGFKTVLTKAEPSQRVDKITITQEPNLRLRGESEENSNPEPLAGSSPLMSCGQQVPN